MLPLRAGPVPAAPALCLPHHPRRRGGRVARSREFKSQAPNAPIVSANPGPGYGATSLAQG